MRILWHLEAPVLRRPKLFARFVRAALHSLVMVDWWICRAGLVPPLYRSGVRFQAEPRGRETFRDACNVYRRGHGDCAHLACWRAGELRADGERATLRVMWRRKRPGNKRRLFHVQVRRENGEVEDPSRRLGMGRD
jgi:hypothetical protein